MQNLSLWLSRPRPSFRVLLLWWRHYKHLVSFSHALVFYTSHLAISGEKNKTKTQTDFTIKAHLSFKARTNACVASHYAASSWSWRFVTNSNSVTRHCLFVLVVTGIFWLQRLGQTLPITVMCPLYSGWWLRKLRALFSRSVPVLGSHRFWGICLVPPPLPPPLHIAFRCTCFDWFMFHILLLIMFVHVNVLLPFCPGLFCFVLF